MSTIYKHAHFLPDAFGHGGSKRTAQINELLADAGLPFNDADFGFAEKSTNKAALLLKGARHQKKIGGDLKRTYAIGRYRQLFESFVKKNKPGLFIWESTTEYFLLLAEILHNHNIPLIGLPHNLESLVPGAASVLSNKTSPDWMFEEVKYLKYCQKVFTISREEAWLLSVMGVNASYLPYYPAREAEKFLLDIRSERELHKKLAPNKDLLLLGTFYNNPTAEGYIELIGQLKSYKDITLHVAGYGSERIKDIFSESNVHIYGSVTPSELKKLIIKCDCALIRQQSTGGALTRIPELLIAGIPVIANVHAARSYFDLKGLKVYYSYPELLDMLNDESYEMPPAPERPVELKLFMDYVGTENKKRLSPELKTN